MFAIDHCSIFVVVNFLFQQDYIPTGKIGNPIHMIQTPLRLATNPIDLDGFQWVQGVGVHIILYSG